MQTFRETDSSLVGRIAALQDKSSFKELHWDGTFEEYLKIVRENPIPTRLSADQVEDYLRRAVDFRLTVEHRAGMEEFRRRCLKHGLI